MSANTTTISPKKLGRQAPLFAALGDETRLSLLLKLSGGSLFSITRLAEGSSISRQAITKHLRVLEASGLIRSIRQGRENLFQLEPKAIAEARGALELISQQWDQALLRLKAFVEK